jgi:5-methyltetrahydropteroyltriglutamate--homocysteine methyltransferase
MKRSTDRILVTHVGSLARPADLMEMLIPEEKIFIPGVVGHYSDFIEHPRAIADRLVRYAQIIGRENVIAGTDCGIGSRVGHPQVGWAKFQAMAEGARLASEELWRN